MLNEEVVLVDSDDETPKAIEMDTSSDKNTNDKEDAIANDIGLDDSDDIVVEYNSKNNVLVNSNIYVLLHLNV